MKTKVKIKVCGMNEEANIKEIASLEPDFLGFIFYENSKRNFTLDELPSLNRAIKKVGVFVNESINIILKKVKNYHLDYIQLHGNEDESYCLDLINQLNHNQLNTKIVKSFLIDDDFTFGQVNKFQFLDGFLFDTKGKFPGGNGTQFDWKILKKYEASVPYFLSGGIGLDQLDAVKHFLKQPEAKYCFAIDVNSKFELDYGIKDKSKLEQFKQKLYEI